MKTFFTLLIIALAFNCFAQTKSETLNKTNIGRLKCEYNKAFTIGEKDTSKWVLIMFQDMQYSELIKFEGVSLHLIEIPDFLTDLKAAMAEMDKGSTVLWKKDKYEINLDKGTFYLDEAPKDGDGYTKVSKAQVEKLIAWFAQIGFKA